MKTTYCFRTLSVAALSLLLASSLPQLRAADLSQAKVRQKFNVVTLAPNLSASAHPVAQGAVIQNENVVRTGTESRAELEFTDLTLARIGANSIFTFDAQNRSLVLDKGAVLFSKPTNSGRVEIRSGAVTAAITGSTGFVSTSSKATGRKKAASANREQGTTMLGMIEGKVHGTSTWQDNGGRGHSLNFSLGAGEMLIAQPGRPPAVVQFDIAKFMATSPLVKGFKGDLLNLGDIRRAVADYQTDERRGFIEPNTVTVNRGANLAWVGFNSTNHNSFDVSVDTLGSRESSTGNGVFLPVGGDGVVRGQLVWTTSADLDLHLILPNNQEVFFGNTSVSFNNMRATATLDHDNRGGTIDQPPSFRVENITVNGTLSPGAYTFFANSFFTSNGSDSFTLTVSGANGQTQVIRGTLSNNQNSQNVVVQVPGTH